MLTTEVEEKNTQEQMLSPSQVKLMTSLKKMVDDCEEIIGAVVTTGDGVPWAQVLPDGFDANRYAAMSSSLLALCDTMVKDSRCGATINVMLEGSKGNVFVLHAGDNMLLTVFTKLTPHLGLSLSHARRAVDVVVKHAHDTANLIEKVAKP